MKNQFNSIAKANNDQLLELVNDDMQVMATWITDTMSPVISCSAQKTILYEMESEIQEHIKTKGTSDKAESSLKRIESLITLNEKIFNVCSENRMLQLSIQHAERKMSVLAEENRKYKKRIEAIEAEWKSE